MYCILAAFLTGQFSSFTFGHTSFDSVRTILLTQCEVDEVSSTILTFVARFLAIVIVEVSFKDGVTFFANLHCTLQFSEKKDNKKY